MFNQKDIVTQYINRFLFFVFSFPSNQKNEGETIISGLRGQRGFHSYIGDMVSIPNTAENHMTAFRMLF